MDRYDYDECARMVNLITNRVGACNQLLGARYKIHGDNPVKLVSTSGGVRVLALDVELGEYKGLDLDSLRRVYDVVDSWAECIWHLSRTGFLKVQSACEVVSRSA